MYKHEVIIDDTETSCDGGNQVCGKVLITIPKPRDVTSVEVVFKGCVKTIISGRNGLRFTYSEKILLWAPQDESGLMPAGEHVFPFRFVFPYKLQLPPSLKEVSQGQIKYFIESIVHRPELKLCDTKTVNLTFTPKLDISGPEYGQVSDSKVSTSLLLGGGPIEATLKVPRKGWAPGDQFEIEVYIQNNSSKALNGFAVVLRADYNFFIYPPRSSDDRSTVDTPIENFPDLIPPKSTLSKKVSVTIPPVGQTITMGAAKIIERLYSIVVVINTSMLHFNITLLAPIVIGTVPYRKSHGASSELSSAANFDSLLDDDDGEWIIVR